MRFLPGNAQHIGARNYQQDSFGFADPDDEPFIAHGGFLAIVCDGMGGMEHGDAASRTAVRAFLDAYGQKTPAESIPDALIRSVHTANDQVVGLARGLGLVEGVGTTLVAAAICDGALYFVSVGDSGLFHVSGGNVQAVNHPHVFANYLDQAVERGQMTREAAMTHPERESLTSYIGAERLDEIDRNLDPWPLRDGDTVLIASDGMFKTLDPDEIAESLRGEPTSWPDALVERTLAKAREFQDNVTVISVTLESESRATSPRTVLLAPPPPAAAGVPVEPAEIPHTAMLPLDLPAPTALPTSEPFPVPQSVAQANGTGMPAQPTPSPALAQPEIAPAKKGKGVWLGAGVLLLAAGGAGWWLWSHRPPAQPGARQEAPIPSPPTRDPSRQDREPDPILIRTAPANRDPLDRPLPSEKNSAPEPARDRER